jgi:hypothetical protein
LRRGADTDGEPAMSRSASSTRKARSADRLTGPLPASNRRRNRRLFFAVVFSHEHSLAGCHGVRQGCDFATSAPLIPACFGDFHNEYGNSLRPLPFLLRPDAETYAESSHKGSGRSPWGTSEFLSCLPE